LPMPSPASTAILCTFMTAPFMESHSINRLNVFIITECDVIEYES
jgi:hypothetical protein